MSAIGMKSFAFFNFVKNFCLRLYKGEWLAKIERANFMDKFTNKAASE